MTVLNAELASHCVRVCGLCWLTHPLRRTTNRPFGREANLRIAACTFYGLARGRPGAFTKITAGLTRPTHGFPRETRGVNLPTRPDKLGRRVHIFEAIRLRCILDQLSAEQKRRARDGRSILLGTGWSAFSKTEPSPIERCVDQWEKMYLPDECALVAKSRERDPDLDAPMKSFRDIPADHIAKRDDAC